MFLRTSPRSTNWKTKCFASRWFLGKIEEIWEQYPFLIRGQDYAILLMPDLILNLEWTLGISVGSSPISLFWVLALVRYISKFGDLGIWGDFKNVGSSPIYSSVGSRTDPRTICWKRITNNQELSLLNTGYFFADVIND